MTITWRYMCLECQRYFDDHSEVASHLELNQSHQIVETTVSDGHSSQVPETPDYTSLYVRESGVVTELSMTSGSLQVGGETLVIEGNIPINSFSEALSQGQSFTISGVGIERILGAYYLPFEDSNNLALGWTPYDPNNYSSNEAGLNDENTSALVYNNLSSGPVGKWFGYDAGSSENVNQINVWDWSATYVATEFAFETSDAADFSTINYTQSFTNDASSGKKEYTLSGVASGRYSRIRCISAVNASWWVITEFETFYYALSDEFRAPLSGELLMSESNGSTVISGVSIPTNTTVKVGYL